MGRYINILFLFLFFQGVGISQENHFSQFYNTAQYINPAFAGDAYYLRVGNSTRIMRPVPNYSIINSFLQFDQKIINHRSGIGVSFYNHTEELSHSKLKLNYSYSIQLNRYNWVKTGLGISINQRRSRATELTFPDQYDILGFTGNPSAEPDLKDNSYFPGLSAGFVFYNKYSWISFSGDYLNFPKENFAGFKTIYPIKLVAATGFLYPINKNKTSKRRFSKFGGLKPASSVGPVFGFMYQNKYTEISTGLSTQIQPIYGGLHYRYQHDFNLDESKYAYKAIVIIAGYRQEEFSVSYSYDISLNNYSTTRNGAHELSFTWYFYAIKEDYKKVAMVPLPNQMIY